MQLVPVSSSMIRAVGYDPDTSKLGVEFSNGTQWEYNDVPQDTYDRMLGAGSVGQFFNSYVKNSFDGQQV